MLVLMGACLPHLRFFNSVARPRTPNSSSMRANSSTGTGSISSLSSIVIVSSSPESLTSNLPLESHPTTLPRYPSSVWISFLRHASISGRGLELAAVSPDDFAAVGPDETSSHSEQLKVSACHAWMLVMHKSSYLQENCQWPNTLHKSSHLQETADGRSEFFSACIFRSFTRLYLLYNLFLLFFLSSFFRIQKGSTGAAMNKHKVAVMHKRKVQEMPRRSR